MQNESRNGAQSANGCEVMGGGNEGRTRIAEPLTSEGHGSAGDAVGQMQGLAADEVEEIGSLGNEEDDPEGWMSERVDYWASLPPSVPPTREAWLRSVIANATQQLVALMTKRTASWPTQESDISWTNLANEALGLPLISTGATTNTIQVKKEPDDGEEPECEMTLA